MSVYLEAVAQAREHRDTTHQTSAQADAEFRAALARAAQHHSLREIARHAGITFSGVKWIIDQKEPTDVSA